ncbi:secreted antigen 1 [Babesia caballi]|uniref:Secreted antigen 1 n=1 Tax=Babesia caballi TaxID=5871 RepID=A0AAV4LLV3_BABCB|nr:secreted antigen 1 [Babesia caballi]
MAAGTGTIKPPKTLRAALDFLAKLNNTLGITDEVGEALKSKVNKAINGLISSGTKSDISFIHDIIENLKNVLRKACELRDEIVNINREKKYGDYSEIELDNRAEECATIIIGILPYLYNTLFYLNFQVSDSFRRRGSGGWITQTCKPQLNDENYLNEWLLKRNGIPSSKSSSNSLLPGGYDEKQLSSNDGLALHGALFDFVDAEGEETCFSNLIVSLIFVTEVTGASTAIALIFVTAFCRAVLNNVFANKMSPLECNNLTNVCSELLMNLGRIVPRNSDIRSSNLIACESAVDYCTRILKSDDLEYFVVWLKCNLNTIILNLKKMAEDCKQWDNLSFDQGKYAGPFAYGFMFGVGWGNGAISGQDKFSQIIKNLTARPESKGSMKSLLKCLDPRAPIIVNDEQPQQEDRRVEADSAPAESGSGPGSSTASGMVSEIHGDGSVASTAAEVQSGRQNAQSSGGHSATSSPVESPPPKVEIDENLQQIATAPNFPAGNEASGTDLPSETSAHNTGPEISGVSHPPDQTPAQSGSSGSQSDSDHVDGEASDSNGDTSTITIGSAAGGVAVLGGGGAALYFLNVGGIKTLITGVP